MADDNTTQGTTETTDSSFDFSLFTTAAIKEYKNTDDTLKEFASFSEANNALWNACANGKPPAGVKITNVDDCVTMVYNTKATIDKYGKLIKQGGTCSVCGKHVDYVPMNGYCSIECFTKDLLKHFTLSTSKNTSDLNKILDNLLEALDFLNMVLNVVAELPQKLRDLLTLPSLYRNFLLIRINIIFLLVKILINKIMIFKNNLIIKVLKPIQQGFITDKIASLVAIIGTIMNTINALKTTLDTAYSMLLRILQNPMFAIPPESFVWFCTPRTIARGMPYVYTEVPVNMSIAGNMFGPLSMLNINAINATVQGLFPPITAIEYFMKPEWFDVRLALSDLSDIVKQFTENLELILKFGPDYLPRYKNLNLKNPWFILAILVGWGPKAQMHFGSFIYPFV